MHGWELRKRRHGRGLTLADVARACGTSESNISAYERGAKTPNAATLRRMLAALSVDASSPVHARKLVTVPAAAATIRSGLRKSWSTADLLRVVRELGVSIAAVTEPAEQQLILAAPSTTGDQRWDALLAAMAEQLAAGHGVEVPDWTAGHTLPTFWFVGTSPSLRAHAFARTPISMQVRGVMVDPDDLVAV